MQPLEYDRVPQSDGGLDGEAEQRRRPLRERGPVCLAVAPRRNLLVASLLLVGVAVLIAWGGVGHHRGRVGGSGNDGNDAEQAEAPSASDDGPTAAPELVGSEFASRDPSDGDDGVGTDPAAIPSVSEDLVASVHGKIPKSFYDTPPGVTSKSCAERGREEGYICIGDRLGHTERMDKGVAMCSHHGRYMFGMNSGGNLIWSDCFEDEQRVYYEGAANGERYFVLGADAAFTVLHGSRETVWKKGCKFEVRETKACLGKPSYDCPYLHLHSDGVLVLNWIEDGGDWKSKNVDRLYPF